LDVGRWALVPLSLSLSLSLLPSSFFLLLPFLLLPFLLLPFLLLPFLLLPFLLSLSLSPLPLPPLFSLLRGDFFLEGVGRFPEGVGVGPPFGRWALGVGAGSPPLGGLGRISRRALGVGRWSRVAPPGGTWTFGGSNIRPGGRHFTLDTWSLYAEEDVGAR